MRGSAGLALRSSGRSSDGRAGGQLLVQSTAGRRALAQADALVNDCHASSEGRVCLRLF